MKFVRSKTHLGFVLLLAALLLGAGILARQSASWGAAAETGKQEGKKGKKQQPAAEADKMEGEDLDKKLGEILKKVGFTGNIESTLEKRLGRQIDREKAELGRHLFFDRFLGLHGDNSCAGCHSPSAGFADTQSIAIGVDNNDFVGPNRAGPRNQRRSPSIINNAFYPKLMLNGRFSAISGDPFDNSKGFDFPPPEGKAIRFPPNDSEIQHLLVAQAHIPFTEMPEMAGFTKIGETSFTSSRFQVKSKGAVELFKTPGAMRVLPQFNPKATTRIQVFSQRKIGMKRVGKDPCDDGLPKIDFTQFDHATHTARAVPLPPPITSALIKKVKDECCLEIEEFRNEPIRDVVLGRLNANEGYRKAFGKVFLEVARGGPITFAMVGQAVAEFEFTLTFTDAPIDRFAREYFAPRDPSDDRPEITSMTASQKRGALLFFGEARCAVCHAVQSETASGKPFLHEMFSDFKMRNIGVPQIAPKFGVDETGTATGNVPFRRRDGNLAEDGREDWGLYDITQEPEDRFKFRTSPLRNIATHPTFFHNGCFTRLEDAIRHHLDVEKSLRGYDPKAAGVAEDLQRKANNEDDLLKQLDPEMKKPVKLSDHQFNDLVAFVRHGLLDSRTKAENLRRLIPESFPSGEPAAQFEKASKRH